MREAPLLGLLRRVSVAFFMECALLPQMQNVLVFHWLSGIWRISVKTNEVL